MNTQHLLLKELRDEQISSTKKIDLILDMLQHVLAMVAEMVSEDDEQEKQVRDPEREIDPYEQRNRKRLKQSNFIDLSKDAEMF